MLFENRTEDEWMSMEISKKDATAINDLLNQLSELAKPISCEKIAEICNKPNNFVLVKRNKNGKIVAMATFIIYETLLKKIGRIEDVVVDAEHRSKGIGLSMIRFLIMFAKDIGVSFIELTSNPKREIANKLYEKIGFKKGGTNYFRLDL